MKRIFGLITSFLLMIVLMSTAQAVTLEWGEPTSGGPHDGFKVYYWESGVTSTEVKVDIASPTQTSLTIPDNTFRYQIEYSFRVHAYNTLGEGGPSNIETWTRPIDDVPGPCILRIPGF